MVVERIGQFGVYPQCSNLREHSVCTNSVSNFRCSPVDAHIPVSPVVTGTPIVNDVIQALGQVPFRGDAPWWSSPLNEVFELFVGVLDLLMEVRYFVSARDSSLVSQVPVEEYLFYFKHRTVLWIKDSYNST